MYFHTETATYADLQKQIVTMYRVNIYTLSSEHFSQQSTNFKLQYKTEFAVFLQVWQFNSPWEPECRLIWAHQK